MTVAVELRDEPDTRSDWAEPRAHDEAPHASDGRLECVPWCLDIDSTAGDVAALFAFF
jgi:hypothetical protein